MKTAAFVACGLGLLAIGTSLLIGVLTGVEVRLPPDQQATLERAASAPGAVEAELARVRRLMERAEMRVAQMETAIHQLGAVLEIEPDTAEQSLVEVASQMRRLHTELSQVASELRGLRDDIAEIRGTR